MKKILFLFAFSIPTFFCYGQLQSKQFTFPKKIAWTNVSTGHFHDTGYTITISNDSILIHYVLGFTNHNSILATYQILNGQIVAKVLETLDYETNVGSIRSHYKNNHDTIYINICELYNDCSDVKEKFPPNIAKKLFVPDSENHFKETKFYPIPKSFTEMIKNWNITPQKVDY
jgi:hypothetical protein